MIAHATKMLTSPDPLVRGVAQHSLDCTIRKRYGETDDRWRFLAGQLRCANEGRRGDISSIWSRLRDFVGDIGVRLHGGTDEEPTPTSVTIGDRDLSGNFRKVLSVWDPCTARSIKKLENTQKLALKICSKQWDNLGYQDLLDLAKCPTLRNRRLYLSCVLFIRLFIN